jgi:acylphosphatase
MDAAAKIIVKGLVQGVGYRYFCYKKAIEYGVNGYAKNLDNGDVELEIEGDRGLLNDFINELKTGPGPAQVKKVLIDELAFSNKYSGFRMY